MKNLKILVGMILIISLLPSNAEADLIIDNGVVGGSKTIGGVDALFFNDFTPDAFPVTITKVQIRKGYGIINGNPINIFIAEDTNGAPPTDAALVYTETFSMSTSSDWMEFTLTTPVVLNGPTGNVLVGAVIPNCQYNTNPQLLCVPIVYDSAASAGKSYLSGYSNPISLNGLKVDTRNFMIRAVTAQIGTVPDTSVPEFPTIAFPVIAVVGLMFFFQRRKGK